MIFDEIEHAEKLLNEGFKDFISWYNLLILSKYFRGKGKKDSEIKKEIISFYKKYANYNEILFDKKIDDAIRKSKKWKLKISLDIYITQGELEKIRKLKNYRYERICFVMLAIARYNKVSYENKSQRYFINMNFLKILSLAKVYATKKERDVIKRDLHQKGMIVVPEPGRRTKEQKLETQELLYIDEDSNKEILINDWNNILKDFNPLCLDCGKEIHEFYKKRNQLCTECYEKKRLEDIRGNMNKYRNK